MPLKLVVGGVEKAATDMAVIVGGASKDVRRVEAWDGSAWKLVQAFAPAVTLACVPDEVFAWITVGALAPATTTSTTATPTGGTGPFTYSWVQINGNAASISSPTNATTTFTMFVAPGDNETAQFRCTVTDSLSQTASAVVTANFANNSTS